MPSESLPRRIASYGRRHGRRLRSGKKELLETLLPQVRIGIDELKNWRIEEKKDNSFPDSSIPQFFNSPFYLEIGFGGGEHLAHMAGLYPGTHFIGCETYVDGVASLLTHLRDENLENIRIYGEDARNLMEALPDRSLSRVFILYPDPWPKARHHKRRIISKEFLDTLSRLMIPGAELRLATDYSDYATWMLEHFLSHPAFEWPAKSCDDWLKPWDDWLPTRYEKKALAGRPTYLTFRRS